VATGNISVGRHVGSGVLMKVPACTLCARFAEFMVGAFYEALLIIHETGMEFGICSLGSIPVSVKLVVENVCPRLLF
jgi:hypothetical protein